jgi:GGDEF domain-containing protein
VCCSAWPFHEAVNPQADYIFRWGGDEFVVLITCGAEGGAEGGGLEIVVRRGA